MTDTSTAAGSGGPGGFRRLLRSPWIHLLIAFTVLALVQGFFVKVYQVPSESMEPTLQTDGLNSDRMLVNRLAYLGEGPDIGDVIVFNADEIWHTAASQTPVRQVVGAIGDIVGFGPSNQHALVKRVLAGPGDTLEGVSGQLLLNGEVLNEVYLDYDFEYTPGTLDCTTVPKSLRCFDPVTVPEGKYLVLGDNRVNSADSLVHCRHDASSEGCARFVDAEDVVGEAILVAYPFNRWGQELSTDLQAGEPT